VPGSLPGSTRRVMVPSIPGPPAGEVVRRRTRPRFEGNAKRCSPGEGCGEPQGRIRSAGRSQMQRERLSARRRSSRRAEDEAAGGSDARPGLRVSAPHDTPDGPPTLRRVREGERRHRGGGRIPSSQTRIESRANSAPSTSQTASARFAFRVPERERPPGVPGAIAVDLEAAWIYPARIRRTGPPRRCSKPLHVPSRLARIRISGVLPRRGFQREGST
jgi:hypothetical protein